MMRDCISLLSQMFGSRSVLQATAKAAPLPERVDDTERLFCERLPPQHGSGSIRRRFQGNAKAGRQTDAPTERLSGSKAGPEPMQRQFPAPVPRL